MNTFNVFRKTYPVIKYSISGSSLDFNIYSNITCTLTLVGAGGFSYAVYGGDYVNGSIGKPGWCGQEAICGGQGSTLIVTLNLTEGQYKVTTGILGGGTDLIPMTYSAIKTPSVWLGEQPLETKVYKDNQLILSAPGGGYYTYVYAGNQKNDGPCYRAYEYISGGEFYINNSLNISDIQKNNGLPAYYQKTNNSITCSRPAPYLSYGKPNDVTSRYGGHYNATYSVSGGTGGYFSLTTNEKDKGSIKIQPNPFKLTDGNRFFTCIRKDI